MPYWVVAACYPKAGCIPGAAGNAVVELDPEEDSRHILRLHLHTAVEGAEVLVDTRLDILHMVVEENEIVVGECCCIHNLVDWQVVSIEFSNLNGSY